MNPGRSNNLSLKYQRFTPSGSKDIGIIKFETVAKTQFLYKKVTFLKKNLIRINSCCCMINAGLKCILSIFLQTINHSTLQNILHFILEKKCLKSK